MDEKKMTLEELVGWLDDNDVSCEIDDAGRLTVEGSLCGDFRDWVGTCKYTSLPDELVCAEGDLWLEDTPITSLGNLTSVGSLLDLGNTPITSLGNLTSVGEGLNLWNTSTTSLGNLTSVGGFLALKDTPITSLGNLVSVGKWLDLRGTPITSLGNLTSVGEFLDLCNTHITSLDDLPQVGEHLYLDRGQFQLLTREALQKVKGKIKRRDQVKCMWIALSPPELEAILAENERRES